MGEPVHIVFCADRRVLPGLHVAAYSLLEHISLKVPLTSFYVFSDQLDEGDLALLRQTLAPLQKKFTLELRQINRSQFNGFPSMNNSWAAYYRLAAPQALDIKKFIYVDVDILCAVDLSELYALDLGKSPAGLVPEASLAYAADRFVAEKLGNSPVEPYYNSGVILVNVDVWRQQQITEKAMEYLAKYHPSYWDQSALNVVLHGNAISLNERFNSIANMRKYWPCLRQPYGQIGRLIHFLDYPKPWDFLGEYCHPQYRLWRAVLDKTAMKQFRSWHATSSRKFPGNRKSWNGYKKALKDHMLFTGYIGGWFKHIKGVP